MRSRERRFNALPGLVASSVFALGCSGEIGDGNFNDPLANGPGAGGMVSGGVSGGSGAGSLSSGAKSGAGAPSVGGSSGPSVPSVTSALTRVARLTHQQYENTVRELLGISDALAADFAPDALNGFAFDTSVDHRVDARLGPQYRKLAEELAERAVTDDAVYARIVGCDETCADAFISSFLNRAFRRPATLEEVTRFRALFDRGEELVGSGNAFRDGVRLVVEAALQSPQFLYRAELGTATGSDGQIALDSWETASRLSYLAWDSMPDAELLELAASSALHTPAEVEAVLRRLLDDPRATQKLVSFHEQAWQFARFSKIAPDRDVYPDAPPDMINRVTDASRRFVAEVIGSGGGLVEFLTAPYAFADSALAPLYGVNAGSTLERIDFPAGSRQGFLMQLGFLASNSYSIKTDPIHRGLFVMRDLLCRPIPDPPPGASMMPAPPTDEPPKTTREEVNLLTGQDGCRSCHDQINPAGFAFEGFDAVGQSRSEEDGTPVDTSGTLLLDGTMVSFAGPRELTSALASSQEARTCYAAKWLAFAYGHDLSSEDDATVSALSAAPISVRDLLVAIAKSRPMLARVPNEVAP
jgi:hypothetical protein